MAMADLIASHIDSALRDVGLLFKYADLTASHIDSKYRIRGLLLLRFRLNNLKRFLLTCAREAACDASLGSLLMKIEDVVRRNAVQLRNCLARTGGDDYRRVAAEFHKGIRSLLENFDEWYSIRQSSASCTPHGVLEIIREALVDVRSVREILDAYPNLKATIQVLEEQLSFMKALISFATKLSAEPIHYLLAPAESVTTFLAYRLITLEIGKDLDSLIPEFLQKKLVPVYETYNRALGSLKSERWLIQHMGDHDAFDAMKEFVDSILSIIWDCGTWLTLTQNLLGLQTLDPSMQDLQELYGGLRSLGAALKKKQQLSMKITGDIRDAVCDAGIFICSLQQRGVDLELLHSLMAAINCILAIVAAGEKQEIEVKRMPSLGASSSTNEVVGFEHDEQVIVDQLTRGSQQLQIVAIVGMLGLGKTTLATKVYNNLKVSYYFHVRARCHVSQTADIKNLLLSLLNQIDPSRSSKRSTADELAQALRQSLLGRKYLIFLDDVWDTHVWKELSTIFLKAVDIPNSRIMLTSRQHDVAPDRLVDGMPYCLRQLNEKESLELLRRECSFQAEPESWDELGIKFADKCQGLPLMIVIVAGVLKHAEPESWNELLDQLSSVSIMEQCRKTLELSYMQLPANLKPCLLYFGTFLENQEVSVRRLLRLWIAEDFIQGDDMKSPEDCLRVLIHRSLIIVAKQSSLGGVKTCRIHDLIRDFCVQKAKDEHLFHLVRGYDELSAFNEPRDLQRLCIHSEPEHFKQSRLFCPCARSLILNSSESTQTLVEGIEWRRSISYVFRIFKRLQVLDLEQVHLGYRFPDEIKQLAQLTFLAILCEERVIPPWICDLSGLETLIKLGDTNGRLPYSLWHLHKLQHLYLGGGDGYYTFSEGSFDSPLITLQKLDRISGVVIPYSCMESLLRKLPNIRKLKCRLQYSQRDGNNLVCPNILSQIQSLSMLYVYDDYPTIGPRILDLSLPLRIRELSLPENLKKLTLGGFGLSQQNMSTIGLLPNLEVLKLLRIKFEDKKWSMRDGEFSKVKVLKLVDLDINKWCSEEDTDHLERMEKLVLESISYLEELPSCLEKSMFLEIIEVSDCYHEVLNLVEVMEERRNFFSAEPKLKIIRNNIRVQV